MGFWKTLSNGLSYLDPTRSSGTLYKEHPIATAALNPFGITGNLGLQAASPGGRKALTNAYEGVSGARNARNAAEAQKQAIDTAGGQVNQYYQQATDYQQPLYEQGMRDYTTLGNMVRGGQFDMQNREFVNPEQQPGAFSYGQQSPGAYQNMEQQPGAYVNQEQQPGQYVNPEQQPGAYVDKGFTFNPNEDPGAQFRMQQGTAAVNTNAAAKGGGLSGATLKALSKYGSNLGSLEYGAAYNRYYDDRKFGYDANKDRLDQYNKNRTFGYDANQNMLDQYNKNRTFGYDANKDRLDQYNKNRTYYSEQNQQNIDNWQNTRDFAYKDYGDRLGQFNKNRTFGYDAFTNSYDRANSENTNRYNRYGALANVGTGSAANLGNIAMSRGDALGNLSIQRGNATAQGIVAPGNANRALAGQIFNGITDVASKALPALI